MPGKRPNPSKTRQSEPQRKKHAPSKPHDSRPFGTEARPPIDLSPDAHQALETDMQEKLGYTLRDFQKQAIRAQLEGKDVIIHAGTGMGKTVVAAGPHFHPSLRGTRRVTIMVSPLIALQNEQVETFKREFGIDAIAINSSQGGGGREELQALLDGNHQLILMSPELLLTKTTIDTLLRNRDFTSRIFAVVIDEAHVVSHWGASFRKKYGELGLIRAFLPPKTPVVAMSATLPPRVHADLLRCLNISETNHVGINIGNDRPNVAIAVRPIHNTVGSYTDLDFVIPKTLSKPTDIPSTMIFEDAVMNSVNMLDYLETLLPASMRGTGLIRPFNAAFSNEYRDKLLRLFKRGRVRVLICTDAAGMGCNLPDVDVVVQWKLPPKLSMFVQRAGRVARGKGTPRGLAVLLVEKTAYEANAIPAETVSEKSGGGTKQKNRSKSKKPKSADVKKAIKVHAIRCGLQRGALGGKNDTLPDKRHEPEVKRDDDDEGLISLIQTTVCRRRVNTKVYKNVVLEAPEICCDLCNPELLDLIRPGKARRGPRQTPLKKGELSRTVQTALRNWRTSTHETHFPLHQFPSVGILSDELIDSMASMKRPQSIDELGKRLSGRWRFWEKFKDDLWKHLGAVDESQFSSGVPLPKVPKPAGNANTVPQLARTSGVDGDERSLQAGSNDVVVVEQEEALTVPSPPTLPSLPSHPASRAAQDPIQYGMPQTPIRSVAGYSPYPYPPFYTPQVSWNPYATPQVYGYPAPSAHPHQPYPTSSPYPPAFDARSDRGHAYTSDPFIPYHPPGPSHSR